MSNQIKKVNRQKRLKKARNIRHNNGLASAKGLAQTPTMTQMLSEKRRNKQIEEMKGISTASTVTDKLKSVAKGLKALVSGSQKAVQ